jgi:hypothetical protein
MQRRRKLIDMSQDDLSSFRAHPGRGCSSTLRSFKARIEAGGPLTQPDAVASRCDSLSRI